MNHFKFKWHVLTLSFFSTLAWALAATLGVQAGEFQFSREVIQSPDRENASRVFVIEPQSNDRTLLLVVEHLKFAPGARPSDLLSQAVIFRKSFGAHQADQLRSTLAKFHQRSALSSAAMARVSSLEFTDGRPLWVTTKSWTLDEEKAFGQWVNTTVDTHILEGGGVLVDCADTALTLRWIYARDHSLPVGNRLDGGELIGSFSRNSEWDRLHSDPNWKLDERFKAALRVALEGTYTHSIMGDLYPVQITSDFVTPGTIHLNLYSDTTGHTETIKVVGQEPTFCSRGQCITTIWGNEPAREVIFYSGIFDVNVAVNHGGFLRWRWPEKNSAGNWALRSATRMPGYSLEQYQFPGLPTGAFEEWVEEKIGFTISPHTKIDTRVATIYTLLGQRADVVVQGIAHCLGQNCAPGTDLYDAYSTPSRDRRIKEMVADLTAVIATLPAGDDYGQSRIADYGSIYYGGYHLGSYSDLVQNVGGILDLWSNDPRDSWMKRWGLGGATPTADDTILTQYGLITRLFDMRNVKVATGYYTCVYNGAHCDLQSPAVRDLYTTTEDALMRSLKASWNAYLTAHAAEISPQTLGDVQAALTNRSVDNCYANHDYCRVSQFMDPANTWMNSMTAVPTDPFDKRWGVPPMVSTPDQPQPGDRETGGNT